MHDVSQQVQEASGAGAAELGHAAGVMIHERRVVPRRWRLATEAGPGAIVPHATWRELEAQGVDLSGVGVSIENHEDARVVRDLLDRVPVIAVAFPSWRDGRAYSQVRKIRYLWGYRGVVLAHGEVLRDQLLWMSRCGVDAFHLREDQDPVASLAAFSLYSAFYQY